MFKSLYTFAHHHWLTIAFILGFIADNLTLNRVDQLFDNIVLLTYVILAMLSILGMYAGISERYSERFNKFLREKSPFVMQYAFGGILSGMLIFYGRSSSLTDSWPFLLVIIAVIYGNETIKERAQRLVYNLVIFFIGLFAYCTLVIPVVLGRMGPWVFVGSGLLAVLIMIGFLRLIERVVPNYMRMRKRFIVFVIGLIYLGMNVLYFTNIIPPIPLSLKHIGIYHSVVRGENNNYIVQYEKPEWWEWFRSSDNTFHAEPGEPVFCYASVFAPARLNTKIYHRWEQYDSVNNGWKLRSRIPYPIAGGRNDGYRGYTQIGSYTDGVWRCTVETERGQVIGKETFEIKKGDHGTLVTREE